MGQNMLKHVLNVATKINPGSLFYFTFYFIIIFELIMLSFLSVMLYSITLSCKM